MKKTKILGSLTSLLMVCSMVMFVFIGCQANVEVTPIDGEVTDGELIINEIHGNGSSPDIFKDGIIIKGSGFGDSPTVSLLDRASKALKHSLTVASANAEAINANFPEDLEEGEYSLRVSSASLSDEREVTILKGDTGEKGEKGDTGDTGSKGDTGDTGLQGSKGDKGDTGNTGPQGPEGCCKPCIPTNGLMAYYPFNGNANDESGNEKHGTNNGATITTDRFGNTDKAYSFDGSDDIITIPVRGSDFTDSVTVAIWVYRTKSFSGSGTDPMMGIIDGGQVYNRAFLITVNHEVRVGFNVYTTSGGSGPVYPSTTGVLPDSTWKHLALTYDGSTLKAYIDGTSVGSANFTGNIDGDVDSIIGRETYNNDSRRFWGGKLDDIRIYNRALSETEIQALYIEGGWTGI